KRHEIWRYFVHLRMTGFFRAPPDLHHFRTGRVPTCRAALIPCLLSHLGSIDADATWMGLDEGVSILLVADSDYLRHFATACLRRSGFRVIEAEDGQSGLQLFEKDRAEIDLILTDLTMPRMSGMEMIREIRRMDATAKVVLMSGNADLADVLGNDRCQN